MDSNDFKERFKRYQHGKVTDEEEKLVENELEKLDEYQNFLDAEFEEGFEKFGLDVERAILRRSKFTAYLRTGLTAIIATLLILPSLNLLIGYYYYSGGKNSKINGFQKTTDTAIYLTAPNIQIHNSNSSVKYFQINYSYDLYQKVGKKEKFIYSDEGEFILNKVKKDFKSIPKPNPNYFLNTNTTLESLNKLHEGTVVHLFIVLNESENTETIDSLKDEYNLDIIWRAVEINDTGFDKDDYIGYPEDLHLLNGNDSTSAEAEFKKGLIYLSQNEDLANDIIETRGTSFSNKLNHIKTHGVSINGLSITGPTSELIRLLKDRGTFISDVFIGGQELWDW
jgi:hypothetical protein